MSKKVQTQAIPVAEVKIPVYSVARENNPRTVLDPENYIFFNELLISGNGVFCKETRNKICDIIQNQDWDVNLNIKNYLEALIIKAKQNNYSFAIRMDKYKQTIRNIRQFEYAIKLVSKRN